MPPMVRGSLRVPGKIAIAISLTNGALSTRRDSFGVVGRNALALVSDDANNALDVPVRGSNILGTGNNAIADRIAGGKAVGTANAPIARFAKALIGRRNTSIATNSFENYVVAGGNKAVNNSTVLSGPRPSPRRPNTNSRSNNTNTIVTTLTINATIINNNVLLTRDCVRGGLPRNFTIPRAQRRLTMIL